jgi:hypothetical protein
MHQKTLSVYLEENGLTLGAFGRRIGMTGTSVWRIKVGRQLPRQAKRLRILEETNFEVDVWAVPIPAVRDDHHRD